MVKNVNSGINFWEDFKKVLTLNNRMITAKIAGVSEATITGWKKTTPLLIKSINKLLKANGYELVMKKIQEESGEEND